MAEFGKHQGNRTEGYDGVIAAQSSALTAAVAQRFVNLGNRDGNDFAPCFTPTEKQMCIGLLNVAVQQLHAGAYGPRQIDGNRGLAGPPLAGCYGNNHDQCPSTSAAFRVAKAPARYASRASATVGASVV